MTPFEFIFALISIITSLALAKIITGVVAIIRHEERAGFSWTHAFWVWVAFAVVIGNWGALWQARLYPEWPAQRVLIWLASLCCLYAFCVFVLPEVEPGKPINLKEFHQREARRYITAHNVFGVIAIALILSLHRFDLTFRSDLFAPSLALGLGIFAFLTKGRPQLIASFLLALLATMFMLTKISIIP